MQKLRNFQLKVLSQNDNKVKESEGTLFLQFSPEKGKMVPSGP